MKNGNITKKKTRQQLASELNISVKTMRNACRYTENIEMIERNIGEERAKKFNDVLKSLYKNKKERISDEQIKQLSRVSKEEQIRIVDLIINHPQNAKQIIYNAIPYCTIKTTITLPQYISEWYDGEAGENDISKNQYIAKLLIKIYEDSYTESLIKDNAKEKEFYKQCYHVLAKSIHPDNSEGDLEAMQYLNKLKDLWGI
jgi:uncharacterized membrane-anchored protein YjiN (DUF445 family)